MLNEISLENCAVIFIDESGFFEDLTFVRNDSYGSFRFGKQINANIIYVNDEKDIPLIDINKFKVLAENTKFNYDGKAKTPKIKVSVSKKMKKKYIKLFKKAKINNIRFK